MGSAWSISSASNTLTPVASRGSSTFLGLAAGRSRSSSMSSSSPAAVPPIAVSPGGAARGPPRDAAAPGSAPGGASGRRNPPRATRRCCPPCPVWWPRRCRQPEESRPRCRSDRCCPGSCPLPVSAAATRAGARSSLSPIPPMLVSLRLGLLRPEGSKSSSSSSCGSLSPMAPMLVSLKPRAADACAAEPRAPDARAAEPDAVPARCPPHPPAHRPARA